MPTTGQMRKGFSSGGLECSFALCTNIESSTKQDSLETSRAPPIQLGKDNRSDYKTPSYLFNVQIPFCRSV